MNLQRIFLRRVAGIDPPFAIEKLSPAINVVVGPNGSGKTSLRKAVAATLWPKRDASKSLEIESDWQDGVRTLHADREGGHVSWSENGSPIDEPMVPDIHLAPCYTLGVDDLLLHDNTTDQVIANDIRVAMSGGYDVRGVIKGLFTPSTQLGRRETKEHGDAKAKYHSVQTDQRHLAKEEERLATLREQERAATAARDTIARIDDALALYKTRSALRTARMRIAELPSAIAKLSANDNTLLDQLESAQSGAAEEIDNLGDQISHAEGEINGSGFGANVPAQDEVDAATDRLQQLKTVEVRLAEIDRSRAGAVAKLDDARKSLAGTLDAEAVSAATLPTLEQIERFVRRRDQTRARRDAITQRIRALAGEATGEDAGLLAEGTNLLRDWLAAPSPAEPSARTPIVFATVGIIAIGVALAFLHHLAWLLLAGAGVGVALGAVLTSSLVRPSGVSRSQCEQRFRELGIAALTAWTSEHVRTLLRELERRLATAHLAESAAKERASLERQLHASDLDDAELANEALSLRTAVGIDVGEDLALHEIARACREYADARGELLDLDAQVTAYQRERQSLRERIDVFLREHGFAAAGTIEDTAALGGKLMQLQRRLDKYRGASERRQEAMSTLERARVKFANAETAIRTFYENRGLAAGERPLLESLLRQLPEYANVIAEQRRCVQRVEELEGKLGQRAEFLDADEASLIAWREVEKAKNETLTEISQEIGRIQNRIETARTGTIVAEALARVAITRDALLDAVEQARLAAAGRFLLEQVDEQHEKQSRPAVLERAMQNFAAFTHNAFELTLADSDDAGFRARDTSRNRFVELSELSDGTRIQLLLAVRLAFATSAERDARIPLMLDEALSTSDPDRFRAVVEALAILACEGRQIFYLTSNPADVVAWRAAARGDAAHDVEIVDLGRIRWQQAAIDSAAELALPAPRLIPQPDGMTAEQYGVALGVPPAAAHEPIESLHLFYVLRHNLPLLYRLIGEFRINTLGRWESFSRSGRASLLLADDACRRLDALCACTRAAHEAASIGRGRPVDDQALADSGAVSDRFMAAVRAANREVGGDARHLLEAVDRSVKGFRTDKLRDLEDHLRDHAYLDERPQLDVAEIYARSLEPIRAALADHVLEQKECLALVADLLAAFRYAD